MCLGVPVQVIEPGAATALCRGRNGDEHVHMLLVGMLALTAAVNQWLLRRRPNALD